MNKRSRANWAFIGLLTAYAIYAAVFIAQSSFVVDGERYFALFDDAMISMTFARTLAQGHGLVWFPGAERVEGFTNPLWVFYMAFWHLWPMAQSKVSLAIQISGAVFLLGSLVFVRRIAERLTGSAWAAWVAVFITAFYYPLSNWSLLGMEVSVLLLMLTAAVWMAMRVMDTGRFDPRLYLLLGLMTLVRFDMAVPFVTVWGWLFLTDAPNRRQHLLWGAACLVGFLGGQTLLRWWYYGEIFPNTYYLKMTGYPAGLRVARGWLALQAFLASLKFPLYLVPLGFLLYKRDKQTALLFWLVLAQMAYSVYVGGDAWEHRGGANRYISLGMPFFMVLFAGAWHAALGWASQAAERVLQPMQAGEQTQARARTAIGAGAAAAFFLICLVSLLYFNRLKDDGSLIYSLRNPDSENNVLRYAFLLERSIFVPGTERYARDGLILRTLTTPDATLAVTAAGNIPYFAERPAIDLLGKMDKVIAREESKVNERWDTLDDFRAGHDKWDYAYSLGVLKPDVVVDIRPSTSDQAEPYLAEYAVYIVNNHRIYFRNNSPRVLWDALAAYPQP
ncbi:MAG: hypothetical protein WHV44_07010 [Anaerolineales bacterium]